MTYAYLPRVAHPTRVRVLRALILLGNLALLPGAWFVLETGRPRFVGLFASVALAVLLFDALYLLDFVSERRSAARWSTLVDLVSRLQVPAVLLLAGVVSFTTLGRGAISYALLSLVFATLVVRVTHVDYTNRSAAPELLLVVAASVTLAAGQVLTVYYYAATTDTIAHTTWATQVATTGTLEGLAGSRYFRFPFFHVWGGVAIQLFDLDPRRALAFATLALYAVAVIIAYLLVRNWLGSTSLALVTAIVFGSNPEFIRWATQAHVQSLSFFFSVAFLFLLIGFGDERRVLLAVPLVIAWTLTHHLSVAMAGVLFFTPVVVATLLLGQRRVDVPAITRRPLPLYAMFVTTVAVYWTLVTTYIYEPLGWILFYSPAAQGVPSLQYVVVRYDDVLSLLVGSLPWVVDNLVYALFLVLAGLGVWLVLTTRRIESLHWKVAIAGFFPAAVMFFPNPVWIPLEGVGELGRWGIMTLPLIAPVLAVGLSRLGDLAGTRSLRGVLAAVLVVSLLFTSVASGMTNPTFTELAGHDKYARDYLTDDNMAAIEFTKAHAAPGERVHTPVPITAYLQDTPWPDGSPTGERQVGQIGATSLDGRFELCPGMTVFPTEAFYEDGIRAVFHGVGDDRVSGTVSVTDVASADRVTWDPAGESKVYSNRGTEIYAQSSDGPALSRSCPSQFA